MKESCSLSVAEVEEERKAFWLFSQFLVQYFRNAFHATRCVFGLENT